MTTVFAPDTIEIWAEVTSIHDPTSHLWYVARNDVPRRICDHAERPESPLPTEAMSIVCPQCTDLFVEDLCRGQQRFVQASSPPTRHRRPYADLIGAFQGGTLGARGSYENAISSRIMANDGYERVPRKISMYSFARYVATSSEGQSREAKKMWDLCADPTRFGLVDYYRELRLLLQRTHWKTDDIETLRNATWTPKTRNRSKRVNLFGMRENYIFFWDLRGSHVFDLEGEWRQFGEFELRVGANFGMESKSGEKYALKMVYPAQLPSRTEQRVFRQLIRELRPDSWEEDWAPALLALRQGDILLPVEPTDMDRAMIEAGKKSLASYWDMLDEKSAEEQRHLQNSMP